MFKITFLFMKFPPILMSTVNKTSLYSKKFHRCTAVQVDPFRKKACPARNTNMLQARRLFLFHPDDEPLATTPSLLQSRPARLPLREAQCHAVPDLADHYSLSKETVLSALPLPWPNARCRPGRCIFVPASNR